MVPRKKILVADDDETLLFAFGKIFGNAGYDIDTSESVEHAKELVGQNAYELVITDLHFSDTEPQGGADLILYVRENAPGTPTILFTGFDPDGGSGKHDGAAPDYYLQKPVKSEAIREILREIGILKERAEKEGGGYETR